MASLKKSTAEVLGRSPRPRRSATRLRSRYSAKKTSTVKKGRFSRDVSVNRGDLKGLASLGKKEMKRRQDISNKMLRDADRDRRRARAIQSSQLRLQREAMERQRVEREQSRRDYQEQKTGIQRGIGQREALMRQIQEAPSTYEEAQRQAHDKSIQNQASLLASAGTRGGGGLRGILDQQRQKDLDIGSSSAVGRMEEMNQRRQLVGNLLGQNQGDLKSMQTAALQAGYESTGAAQAVGGITGTALSSAHQTLSSANTLASTAMTDTFSGLSNLFDPLIAQQNAVTSRIAAEGDISLGQERNRLEGIRLSNLDRYNQMQAQIQQQRAGTEAGHLNLARGKFDLGIQKDLLRGEAGVAAALAKMGGQAPPSSLSPHAGVYERMRHGRSVSKYQQGRSQAASALSSATAMQKRTEGTLSRYLSKKR